VVGRADDRSEMPIRAKATGSRAVSHPASGRPRASRRTPRWCPVTLLRRDAGELYRVYAEDDFWAGPGLVAAATDAAGSTAPRRGWRPARTAIIVGTLGALGGVVLVGALAWTSDLRRTTAGRATAAARSRTAGGSGLDTTPEVSTATKTLVASDGAPSPAGRSSAAAASRAAAHEPAHVAHRRSGPLVRAARAHAASGRSRLLVADVPRRREVRSALAQQEPAPAVGRSEARGSVSTPIVGAESPRPLAEATAASRSKPAEFGFER
jgi:hypothetical protein